MKYLPLVWAALARSRTRTLLTLLSVLAAFLLFGLLDSVRSAFAAAGQGVAGADRLLVVSRVSFTVSLPRSLLLQLRSIPGIVDVSYANWFGGIYKDPKNFFPNQAVADNYFDLFPEWQIDPAARSAFRERRTAAIAGESLARRFGWKVGDRIPLEATIFPQRNGSNTWAFDLVGTFHARESQQRGREEVMFFNWNYFDEARQLGRGTVGWYLIRVADPAVADRVAQAVDALSADSDHETKTQSEQAFSTAFVNQFADIGLIVGAIMGAVFFTLVLLTGNTMAQAVRERIPEIGVLKTLGFTGASVLALVLAESVLLVATGGTTGLAIAGFVVAAVRSAIGPAIPMAPVGWSTWVHGLELMAAIGLMVGAQPALRGMRLRIVDALAAH